MGMGGLGGGGRGESVARPGSKFFHTNWRGEGGNVTATTYDA